MDTLIRKQWINIHLHLKYQKAPNLLGALYLIRK